MTDNFFCSSFAVDDGLIGFGLVGPVKVVARDGELVVLPCRVNLSGGGRGVGKRDIDAGDGGVGVSNLRKRHDAYDVDDSYEAEDDEERCLAARLFSLCGAFVGGAAVVGNSSVRRALVVTGSICGTMLVLLILLTLLMLALIAARGGLCRAVLLTMGWRDGTRRLDATGLPTWLLRIGNQLAAVDLRHRVYFLRVSLCGSSCFNWA